MPRKKKTTEILTTETPTETLTPKPERKPNPIYALAYWFMTELMGEEWDHRIGSRYMAEARRLMKPTPDPMTKDRPPAFSLEDVQDCLTLMAEGYWEDAPQKQRIGTMIAVLWGHPPFIHRIPPPAPSVHDHVAYDAWVRRWGRRAYEKGVWDGIYRGWDGRFRTPYGPDGLYREEVVEIIGEDGYDRSLDGYQQLTRKGEIYAKTSCRVVAAVQNVVGAERKKEAGGEGEGSYLAEPSIATLCHGRHSGLLGD